MCWEFMSNFIAGGCSFTFGHELSDDKQGKSPSIHSWAHRLYLQSKSQGQYICVARAGSGNSGIARRVFDAISSHETEMVVVMWSFLSRYDWAMPRHHLLERTRWASISPWDTDAGNEEAFRMLAGSEPQAERWKIRKREFEGTMVKPFAESIYKYAANEYHETYLSWKSIIWLQNILEKKNIKYFFTLADNSLFYKDLDHHKDQDKFMANLHNEIDFTNWFFFGERCMGFNQWASLNDYERGTTHPLDKAHKDATMLMQDKFLKIKKNNNV
jgi:hypothetical protein